MLRAPPASCACACRAGPAVLAWVQLDAATANPHDDNDPSSWEGRVVAVKREVQGMSAAVAEVSEEMSHLVRTVEVHSTMLATMSKQMHSVELMLKNVLAAQQRQPGSGGVG
jgi:hypothetical protein